MKSRQLRFSLIELSIVLVIIAIVMGSIFAFAIRTTDSARIAQTEAKLDSIEEAIAAFLAVNQRIPCPANGSDSLTAVTFGAETGTPGNCVGNSSIGNVHAGVVPVRALQLPDEYMFDGWNRRFTYAVDERFTAATGGTDFTNTAYSAAEIDVGVVAGGTELTSNAAYVLVSHGENGHGAWLRGGASQFNAGSTDADEIENAHIGGGFDIEYVQKSRTSTFDDQVRYKLKYQIVHKAGAVTHESACADAATVISTGAASICSGAAALANCTAYLTSLSTQVNNLCLQ